MIIYRPNGQALISIDIDDESYHYAEIMGRDDVTLYFSLPQYIEFPVGCYITYMAKNYTLYAVDKMRMEHRRDFEYTITFESEAVELENYIYSNPNDGRFKFPLTAKPQEHLSLLCLCLSQKTGVTWTAHNQIEASDKLISYDAMTCLDALKQIADTFETEYRIDGLTRTIHLGKVEFFKNIEDQIALSYGKFNGLRPGVEKVMDNSEKIIGKVYIQGGDRNIDYSQYGSSTLLLPKNRHIWYDGENFYDSAHSGATEFVTSQDGRNVALASNDAPVAEGALDLSDVYPCYDHHVSDVQEVDADNHFWDIYSATFTAGQSTDTRVNYDDCLIKNGQDMTIIFQSGMLAGREFGVKWKTKEVTQNNETVEVAYMEIVPSEQDGYTMPDRTSGFYPSAANGGDVFRVFNVYLPNSYILSAEIEMLHQAVSYLYEHCREKFSIKGEVDPLWSASRWLDIGGHFVPGAYFRFSDPTWESDGVSIRITSVKTFLNKPHKPIVELSNSIGRQGVSSALQRIEAEAKVLPESVRNDSLAFTKRQYQDAKETMDALAKAMIEGFSESISPITVQTMQLIAGSEALQFQFFTNRTCVTPVPSPRPFTYDSQTKQFKAEACALKHMTLGIDDIKPSVARTVSEYLRWTMSSYESAVLDEPTKRYYVYAKCDSDNDGTNHLSGKFHLSENAVEMGPHAESENGTTVNYYYFLCGILNSERDGSRSFAPVYGFTEVLPGQITTDVIRSSNGLSYFDLISNAFNLGDKLKFNVNNSGQLVLNGTFVQTGSGAPAPIGGWCGEYDSTRTYKKGDEVFFQIGDAISTYMYINDTPSSGNDPTDTDYWEATSVGAEGGSGQGVFKSIVFARSATAPATPTGGSYLNPVPEGWSDGVPSGTEILWMSTRVFTSNGESPQESLWTMPQRATSGDGVQYLWSTSQSKPAAPDSGSESTAWTATTDSSWIHLASSSGTGSGSISYSVDPYEGSGTRTGTIVVTLGSQIKTFTIQQSGTGTQITPLTVNTISASGGRQEFAVSAGSSVNWSLTSSADWITLSQQSGTGPATVIATIASSSQLSSRTATLTFKEGDTTIATITIEQEAYNAGTEASISYPSSVTTSATNVTFNISDPSNHGWALNLGNWWQYATSATTVSGNASTNLEGSMGTGDAVIRVAISSGSSALPTITFSDDITHGSTAISINRS